MAYEYAITKKVDIQSSAISYDIFQELLQTPHIEKKVTFTKEDGTQFTVKVKVKKLGDRKEIMVQEKYSDIQKSSISSYQSVMTVKLEKIPKEKDAKQLAAFMEIYNDKCQKLYTLDPELPAPQADFQIYDTARKGINPNTITNWIEPKKRFLTSSL